LRLGAAMRRREFISLVAGVTAWPLEARAQREGKPPVIGIIRGSSLPVNELVVQRLGELGWIEGHNIVLEYRYTEEALPAPARPRPSSPA
jgi:hypothetical protein